MTKWIECKETKLNTNIESKNKKTKIKLVNFTDLSSDSWMISNKQKQCNLGNIHH